MTRARIATAALVIGGVACASPPDEKPESIEIRGERVPVTQLRGVVAALCEAKDLATRDPQAARTVFFDRAHDPLHAIAAGSEGVDRPSAARLLEAKQAVEADFRRPAGPELASHLGRLVVATRAALQELSVSAPRCGG